MAYEAAQVGLSFVQTGLSYFAARKEAAARKAMQNYTNQMLALSNAFNQNAITENEIQARQGFADQAILNQRNALQQSSAVENSAAAAGVEGNSVNQAIFDVTRQAAMVESRRQIEYANTMLSFDQQRMGSNFSAAMQRDNSIIPNPDIGSMLLGAGVSAISKYYDKPKSPESDGSGLPSKGHVVNATIPKWYNIT